MGRRMSTKQIVKSLLKGWLLFPLTLQPFHFHAKMMAVRGVADSGLGEKWAVPTFLAYYRPYACPEQYLENKKA